MTGQVRVLDRGGRVARDVDDAVVWLTGPGVRIVPPDTVRVVTDDKEFVPRVTVVTVGSTVSFPNRDSFNHNVFSLSAEGPFDLGLYGRGEEASTTFPRPGLIKVYCNVHPEMSAFIHVVESSHFSRPLSDGTFAIEDVPAGTYTLIAWHERAAEQVATEVVVGRSNPRPVNIELDARGFTFEQHTNKYGRPYRRGRRRY